MCTEHSACVLIQSSHDADGQTLYLLDWDFHAFSCESVRDVLNLNDLHSVAESQLRVLP